MHPESNLDSKIIEAITRRAAPESGQRERLAAQEPDMQSGRSPRAKPLMRQAAPDCALKLRKAAMSANGQSRTPTQFRSPAQLPLASSPGSQSSARHRGFA